MVKIHPYLTFNGNCLQAFEFYKEVFQSEFTHVGRFKDLPPEYAVDESKHDLIMHMTLPVGDDQILMGSDTSEDFGPAPVVGTNFSISIYASSEAEARRIFNELSGDGKVIMPLAPSFWGSLFGMCRDKFEISWMVSVDLGEES